MKIKELKFIYENQAILTITNEFLIDAVKNVLEKKTTPHSEPLTVVVVSTGKQLYFDRNLFEAFAREELSQQELIMRTEVTGIYRNTEEIIGTNGVCIDSGGLWKLQNKTLSLIDDDLYVEALLYPNLFEKIN